jgi:tetratricopeptide (TPR) repeat protein
VAGEKPVPMSLNLSPASPAILGRFRQKIAANARAWLGFVTQQEHDRRLIEREFANLHKAAEQALLEPLALTDGLRLAAALWPFVEFSGRWLAWQAVLQQALALSHQVPDPALEAQLAAQYGSLARILGQSREGLVWQEHALRLYREMGDAARGGRVLSLISQQYLALNEYERADECGREAVRMLAAASARDELAYAYNNWALVAQQRGEWEAALARHMTAVELFAAEGDVRGQAIALHNLGEVYRGRRQWAEAADHFRRAVALDQQLGDEVNAARTQVGLGIIWHQQGETARALAIHREVEPFFRRLGDRPWLARVINNQGVFLAALHRSTEAGLAYEQAADLHLADGEWTFAASSLINWSELLLDEGRTAEAAACLARAKALLDTIARPPEWVMRSFEQQLARHAAEPGD